MKISWRWLSEYVDLDGLDPVETAERFTLSVAELEGVEPVGAGLEEVRAARIVSVEDHPNADRLKVVKVDAGRGVQTCVSAAPNLTPGAMGVFAPAGVALPNGLKLKAAKMRGVLSEGMLLAEDELGLTDDHTGVIVLPDDAPVGAPAASVLPLEDVLWEIDNKSITHRPDLWGHYGIAREVAAVTRRELKPLDLSLEFAHDDPLTVRLDAPDLCLRYTAYLLDGVAVQPSPLWLRTRLHRLGVRPISNVVDATNYVMLAVGNPIHAFDRRFLAQDTIVIRRAAEGEVLRTLDDVDRRLCPEDCVIADAEKGIALAGVMGGANSEIQDDTTQVVLESACFHGPAIRRTSVRVKHRTEASMRFEKSLDPSIAYDAAILFGKLCLELCPGARIASRLYDVGVKAPKPITVRMPLGLIDRRLGQPMEKEFVLDTLARLGFRCRVRGDELEADVPTWRATKDISIPEDIVEEVGRIYGYDNITPADPLVAVKPPHRLPGKQQEYDVKQFLTTRANMTEIMLYAFEQTRVMDALGLSPADHVAVRNPISSDLPVLRRSLAPGLLASIETNYRERPAYAAFEIARVFLPRPAGELPHQPRHAAGVIVDRAREEDPDAELFFRAKGAVWSLLKWLGYDEPELADLPDDARCWAHPVRAAGVKVGGRVVGAFGQAHPRALRALKLPVGAAVFELDLDELLRVEKRPLRYQPAPRFPGITWDLSVVAPESVRVQQIQDLIAQTDRRLVREVEFVAAYRGDPIPAGRKSVTFSITFRSDERTLQEDEVEPIHQRIVKRLKEQLGCELR